MITLRPATMRDCGRLFAWRNDPVTRAMFIQQEPVKLEEHVKWLRYTLADPLTALFVAEDNGQRVGTGRLDWDDDGLSVEFSVTVAPRWRGNGFAAGIVFEMMRETRCECPNNRLIAHIRETNQPSLTAFMSCGFEFVSIDEQRIATLEYRPQGDRTSA